MQPHDQLGSLHGVNGVETSRINNTELPGPGPITLQFGNRPPKGDPGGAIKWRKVRIREL